MNILLLGNGFDLYHSLPTKYINFLNVVSFLANNTAIKTDTIGDIFGNDKLQQLDTGITKSYEKYKNAYDKTKIESSAIQRLISLGKTNMWFSYLLRSFNKDVGWIDFEKEIAVAVKSFEELLCEQGIKILPKTRLSSATTRYLAYMFKFYLDPSYENKYSSGPWQVSRDYSIEYPLGSSNRIINTEKIIETLADALTELSDGLKLYLQCFVDSVVSKLKTDNEIELCKACLHTNYAITFNYTNTYETLYSQGQTFHLHGNVNDRIVLGINPDSADDIETVDTTFIAFKKYYQRTMYETDSQYLQWLNDRYDHQEDLNLLIMGHSLDITDRDILYELIELASDIKILYYDEKSKAQYVANLVRIFGREGFMTLRTQKNLTFLSLDADFTEFAEERAQLKDLEAFVESYL